MTVACCLSVIVAILPHLEMRAKYGFRGALSTNPGEAVVISWPDEFGGCGDCFMSGFSVPLGFPRPLKNGWLEFEKRIGLQTSSRERTHELPTWLEACCANEIQIKRFKPIEDLSDYMRSVESATWSRSGPRVFDEGWEGFNRALWVSIDKSDKVGSGSQGLSDRVIKLNMIRGY